MRSARYTRRTLMRELGLVVLALVYCLPFYLLVSLALETTEQTYQRPFSPPVPPHLGSFSEAWNAGGQGALGPAMKSSLIITVSSVLGLILLGSLCAYTLARRPGRLSNALYVAFVLGIILPFQLAIIPLFVAMRHVGL